MKTPEQQIAILTEALSFYARHDAWEGYEKDFGDGHTGYINAPALRDKGARARIAIKKSVS